MKKQYAIDLFCGQGAVSLAIETHGYNPIGVDIEPQPRYPFPYSLWYMDAIEFLDCMIEPQIEDREIPLDLTSFRGAKFIWASPPCLANTNANNRSKEMGKEYTCLIAPIRERLLTLGIPAIIENVLGAKMQGVTITLNGADCGLPLNRPRLFEFLNVPGFVPQPELRESVYGKVKSGDFTSVYGNAHNENESLVRRQFAMQLWGFSGDALTQAIPPAMAYMAIEMLLGAME